MAIHVFEINASTLLTRYEKYGEKHKQQDIHGRHCVSADREGRHCKGLPVMKGSLRQLGSGTSVKVWILSIAAQRFVTDIDSLLSPSLGNSASARSAPNVSRQLL